MNANDDNVKPADTGATAPYATPASEKDQLSDIAHACFPREVAAMARAGGKYDAHERRRV